MKKIRDVFDKTTEWIGEKLFPGMEEKARKQRVTWILVALLCVILVGIFRYRAMQQLYQYQRIADAYSVLLGE